MVPLVCLALVLVPLANAGMDMNAMMQQMMQQQMMMQWQNSQKGWGGMQEQQKQPEGGQWWGMENKEDYEAYLKWCEERKMALAEQEQQKMLLEQWEKQEESRKMEEEKARMERESREKHEMMMSEWKMWQRKISMMHEFDDLTYKFAEMRHKYMFAVTMEFLKFCKCSDFTDDLERYFLHGDDKYQNGGDDFELDDLDAIEGTNAVDVAREIANRPLEDQVKLFFGGLANALCDSGRAYVTQVQAWEKQYNFLD